MRLAVCHYRAMLHPLSLTMGRGVLFAVIVVVVSACSSGSVDLVGSEPTLPASSADDGSSTSSSDPGDSVSSDQSSSSVSEPTDPETAGPQDTVAEATVPTTSTTALVQDPLPGDCAGVDSPLLPAQLTYVDEGKLVAVGLNGELVCLVDLGSDAGVGLVEWGAQGDRVMFTNGRVEVLGEAGRPGGVAGPDALAFSWPTGFNMVWLRDGVVQKSTADDRQQRDLVIGAFVSEIVYHPEGQFLLVVVEDGPAGSRILLTDSEGEQAANLVMSADAKISELTAGSNGSSLVFSAEHADGSVHIHSLELAEVVVAIEGDGDDIERSLGVTDEVSVKTVFETGSSVNNIVFDVSGEQIAFAVGDCATGSTIDVVDLVAGGYPLPIDPLLSARPVGFVSATELAILDYDESCSGGDLYVADIVTGATELIRAGVEGAAVRRIESPTRFNLVGVEFTSPVDPQPAP